MKRHLPFPRLVLLLLAGIPAACAVNPATGAREFSLVSESQEIALGRDADPGIVAEMGLYPDSSVQAYVRDLGMRLAAVSERPDLPWTFRVLDDPTVNAFALPGGYIYVTRGILTHLESEAQLAGVLGHEIGHVTARHGANRMSRGQLAQLGLGLGSIFSETVREYGGVLSQATGLLFLRFGRGDELQADELGLRYMTRLGYDPSELADVMNMLDRNSQLAGSSGRVPEWLSTHPDPGNRVAGIQEQISATPAYQEASTVRRDALLDRLDGMTFGANDRNGFVRDGVFHHPDLEFRFQPPAGWRVLNGASAVQSAPEDGSAVLRLRLAEGEPLEEARSFGAQEGVTARSPEEISVGGLPAVVVAFTAQGNDGELGGEMTWIRYQGRTYAFMGLSSSAGWAANATALRTAMRSFARETDAAILATEPTRVRVQALPSPTPWSVFLERYPSEIDARFLAVINQVEEGAALPEGRVKRVVRGGG